MVERQYKDSGIEWIGRIPKEWDVKRLKNLCVSSNSLIADGDWIESQDISDEGIRYYTTGNIGDGVFKEQGNGFITESTFDKLKCTPVYPGDLVFSRLNVPIGRSCIIPNIYPICVVAVDNVIVRPDSSYDKQYLMYVSMCPGYQETNMLIARGTTMQRMSRTQLEIIYLPIPPLPEQQRIASYLDKKCGEIDELIALQEKMIAQLTEYKQAVITEAVTKGLDPNAKLVPSGIEWIGRIPEGWKTCRLKDCACVVLGKMLMSNTPKGQETQYTFERYLKSKNIGWLELILDNGIDEMWFNQEEKNAYLLRDGDIVMNEGGDIGKVALWKNQPYDCYIQNSVHKITVGSTIDNHFLLYTLYFASAKGYLKSIVNQISIAHLTKEKLQNTPITLPPLPEQHSIAAYLDTKCSEINSLIALKRQKIESLNAYKKSIIYEAVTGKTIIE